MTNRSATRTVKVITAALESGDLGQMSSVLSREVRWYGAELGACHSRSELIAWLRNDASAGVRYRLVEVRPRTDRVLLHLEIRRPDCPAPEEAWQVLTLGPSGKVNEIRHYRSADAAEGDMSPPPMADSMTQASVIGKLVPFVRVADLARSVAFYQLLGFRVVQYFPQSGRQTWASMQTGTAHLMLEESPDDINPRHQRILFYLYAANLTGLREHLRRNGCLPSEIADGTPGPKQEMRLSDPDGYTLMIAQQSRD